MTAVPDPDRSGHRLFSALIGLAAVAVLLQGLWAGIFLEHDGKRDAASSWIDVHARGADVAILLAVLATLVALVKLRHRRDLVIGSGFLALLLVAESYLGGLIRDSGKDTLTAVHVPLAMALMSLVVWLPLRARQSRNDSLAEPWPPDVRQADPRLARTDAHQHG
jgi:heme A synthase